MTKEEITAVNNCISFIAEALADTTSPVTAGNVWAYLTDNKYADAPIQVKEHLIDVFYSCKYNVEV